MPENVRRFFALLTALALILGSAAQGVHASDMAAKMTAAMAAEMPMPGGCDGCNGDDAGNATVCFAVCAGIVAVLPVVPKIISSNIKSPSAASAVAVVGHIGRPDPYPPRSTILS